ncbi:MAG: PQQ-binding-like beta-propeller repeat protein [Anaerolineae bacterium]
MVQEGAAWPVFRHDRRNTGRSTIEADYRGDDPWMFQTSKGVFSTPVIDREGTIFVGSADHDFYALRPNGSLKWRFKTGEIIDSAAALPDAGDEAPPTVVIPSGDGNLYCLYCDTGEVVWTFDARVAPRAGYNNRWEGNVALGPKGTIYAGNTNSSYYAIDPSGTLKWTYETGANAWSAAAVADDGTVYWGSNDTFVHAVLPDGERKWRRRTSGFIAASAAIGSDGTIYIGSFDSHLYALDPKRGRVRWKFKTQDHICSSAAISVNSQGTTDAVIFGSTDGYVYAVSPQGEMLWRYDTGAPIRSSPVLGRMPPGEEGWIVYVGSGNGKLYALDAMLGRRRWSYDTTPDYAPLRDRNDLNGSPVLGQTGVYIGGEHGQIWYVPYDYPLHSDDPRGCIEPGEDLPQEQTALYYVTPGGNLSLEPPDRLSASTIITLRLVASEDDAAHDARLFTRPFLKPRRALEIRTDPPFPFDVETGADGRHLHIIPRSFLEPETTYTIHVEGNVYTGGLHIGNWTIGGRRSGRFSQEFTLRTNPYELERIPLQINVDDVSAFEITRFAVPIPTMLASLNQTGFDAMNWIAGVVDISEPDEDGEDSTLILWVLGGHRDEDGVLRIDAQTDLMLPLSGRYRHDAFRLSNSDLEMRLTPVSFSHFELRGQLGPDLRVGETATAFADTKAPSIPTSGLRLRLAGLAGNRWKKLLAMATFITRRYGTGPANRRPSGIRVWSVDSKRPTGRQDGHVLVQFTCEPDATYRLTQHLPAILLIDEDQGKAIPLDYRAHLTASADRRGNLRAAALEIPAGTELSDAITIVVMLDVFPVHRERLP